MDSIRLKTKELQSKMYLTQTHRLRLIDSDSLTHWTHKSGQLCINTSRIRKQRSLTMINSTFTTSDRSFDFDNLLILHTQDFYHLERNVSVTQLTFKLRINESLNKQLSAIKNSELD